jgi:hypothetical protein
MPQLDRPDIERPIPAPTAERGSGFFLALGAVVVAALVGAYVLIGAPGLYQPVAKGPANLAPANVAQEPAPPSAPTPR